MGNKLVMPFFVSVWEFLPSTLCTRSIIAADYEAIRQSLWSKRQFWFENKSSFSFSWHLILTASHWSDSASKQLNSKHNAIPSQVSDSTKTHWPSCSTGTTGRRSLSKEKRRDSIPSELTCSGMPSVSPEWVRAIIPSTRATWLAVTSLTPYWIMMFLHSSRLQRQNDIQHVSTNVHSLGCQINIIILVEPQSQTVWGTKWSANAKTTMPNSNIQDSIS